MKRRPEDAAGRHQPGGMELDDFIRAYEAAWDCGERADLKAFLPEPGHPLYDSVLRELVRVDLEFRWVAVNPGPWRTIGVRSPSSSATGRASTRSPSRNIACVARWARMSRQPSTSIVSAWTCDLAQLAPGRGGR